MEKIVYNYNMNGELFDNGVKLSGIFTMSKSRKYLITGLAALIIAESVYRLIVATDGVTRDIIFLVLAVLIGAYVWVGPILQLNNFKKKSYKEGNMEVTLQEGKITVKNLTDGSEETIDKGNYRGWYQDENIFIIYYGTKFCIIPKASANSEDVELTKVYLKNGLSENIEQPQTAENNEPEFPEFVPPEKSALDEAETEEETEDKTEEVTEETEADEQ